MGYNPATGVFGVYRRLQFVLWAAYIQNENDEGYKLERDVLYEALRVQSAEDPHKID